MFDPILEEICRAKIDRDTRLASVNPVGLCRWQVYLRNEIDPKLARFAELEAENVFLRQQLEEATAPKSAKGKKESAA